MKWIFSHQTALEIWRKAPARSIETSTKLRNMKPPVKPIDTKELKIEKLQNLSLPLHVLVGSLNARKASKSLSCHISLAVIPEWSFIRMPSGLIVSSPELCFLQMAGELTFIDLIVLGYELCGTYRLDREDNPVKGFRNDLPLTNTGKLKSYADKAVNLKGCKNARRAISFIADGSASPMETILTMLLTLPYRFGGYGFPKPLLNYRIDAPLSTDDSYSDFPTLITIDSTGIKSSIPMNELINKSKFSCDLYWHDSKVAVEYDSDAFHVGPDRIEKDAIRRNTLTSAKITMITASRRQVTDAKKLRELAEALSKLLGKRLNYPVKEFALRQANLMDKLLPNKSVEKKE